MNFFLIFLCLVLLGILYLKYKQLKDLQKEYAYIFSRLRRSNALFNLMNEWVKAKIDDRKLETYFDKNGWHRIALYGIGKSGVDKRLYEDLQGTSVEIVYAIDANPMGVVADCDVYLPTDKLEPVDVIIVTAIHCFDEIKNTMEGKVSCPIISLMEVFEGLKIPIEEFKERK